MIKRITYAYHDNDDNENDKSFANMKTTPIRCYNCTLITLIHNVKNFFAYKE